MAKTNPTLAEQTLMGMDSTLVECPIHVYCYKCNGIISKGHPALRFDASTFTHSTCPSTPLKTFSPHRYSS